MPKPDKSEKFLKAMLTMFGIGYFKNAPGTLASFVTCIIYFLIYMSSFSQFNISLFLLYYNPEYVVWFLIIITISSINLINDRTFTDKFAKLFKKKDPKEIVIDEFIGQSIPIIAYSYLSFFAVGSSFDAFFIFFEATKDQPPGADPRSRREMLFFKNLNFLSISISLKADLDLKLCFFAPCAYVSRSCL